MSVRLEPSEYDGEALCPRCGAGLETGKAYKGCTEGVTHEESCARYVWAEDRLCDACEAEFAAPTEPAIPSTTEPSGSAFSGGGAGYGKADYPEESA